MNAEQTARMSSPAVAAALALLAQVRHEAFLVYVSEAADDDRENFDASTAIESAARSLDSAIVAHVARGYPLESYVGMGAPGEDALSVACSNARVSVAARLVAALAAVLS